MLILFVEYHAAFRQSASYMMDQEADMEVVSQAGSVAEGREKMAKGGIDAAIVDVPLPDEGAAEMVGELHDANPSVPVLVLTRAEDPETVEAFLKAGASEILSKQCTFAQILAAVRRLGEDAHDRSENMKSLKHGWRLLSSYPLGESGTKIWVITEADRSSTCLLLPDEY